MGLGLGLVASWLRSAACVCVVCGVGGGWGGAAAGGALARAGALFSRSSTSTWPSSSSTRRFFRSRDSAAARRLRAMRRAWLGLGLGLEAVPRLGKRRSS